MKISKNQLEEREQYLDTLCNITKYLTKKVWNIDCTCNIAINARLKTTYGQFCYNDNLIEIALRVLQTNNYHFITDILLHELTHWYMYINNLDFDDKDESFLNELSKNGAKPSGSYNISELKLNDSIDFDDKILDYVQEMIENKIIIDTNKKVLSFINDFKKINKDVIEELFSNGYCYWFANILANRFDGEIYYLPIMNHFITKIANDFYDIKGIANYNELKYPWVFYQKFEPLESQRIIKNCIEKE